MYKPFYLQEPDYWVGEQLSPQPHSLAVLKKEKRPQKEPHFLSDDWRNYPPKLSYMIDAGSTPRLSSIPVTAFDMGPGPHM